MNVYQFLLGILILILSIALMYHEIKGYNRLRKDAYIRKSLSLEMIITVFMFVIIGILMIYRAFKE